MAKSEGPVHRVVMIPRKPDGSPAIEGDFEVIGDKEFATRAAAEQLGQIAVSNADHARAREQAATTGAGPSLTEEEQARIDEHRDLMAQAAKQAATEVGSAHSGDAAAAAPLERSAPVETATTRTSARKSSS